MKNHYAKQYFEVKDKCRNGLIPFLDKALMSIPQMKHAQMLDIGCGSGVPSLFLLKKYDGLLTALDMDPQALNFLKEKVKLERFENRIKLVEASLFDFNSPAQFDLILAEGLLNMVGFQKGFLKILQLVKKEGFIILHDEHKGQKEKMQFLERKNCKVLTTIELNEEIWWKNHYQCLEQEISNITDAMLIKQFKSERTEIEMYKEDATAFKSIYYVIQVG